MDTSNRLGTESIRKLLFEFSVPAIVGMLVNALYNIEDRIFLVMLPIIGFQVVSSNYFQAIGRAKISIFLSLLRQVIVLLPLLVILPRFFKLMGIWISGPTSDLISSMLTAVFVIREIRRMDKQTS